MAEIKMMNAFEDDEQNEPQGPAETLYPSMGRRERHPLTEEAQERKIERSDAERAADLYPQQPINEPREANGLALDYLVTKDGARIVDDAQYYGDRAAMAAYNNTRLESADLHGIDFRSRQMPGSRMDNADLRGAKLHGSLSFSSMKGADLRGADLSGCNLMGVDLEGALIDETTNLSGANLSSAKISQAQLRRARGWQATKGNPRNA
jgi:uncharacterized protein YjbI with pentapeptide repeats